MTRNCVVKNVFILSIVIVGFFLYCTIANFTPSFPEICREAPNDSRIKIIDQSKLTAKKITTNTTRCVVSLIKIDYFCDLKSSDNGQIKFTCFHNISPCHLRSSSFLQCLFMTFCNCMTSLEFRDPQIGRGVPNACATVKNNQKKQCIDILHYIGFLFKII